MFSLLTVTLLLAVSGTTVNAVYLSPAQDIVLPSSSSANAPLEWLGANSPWFAGPNVNGISNSVPEGCNVDQAAYVVRHGSRYPDSGAYSGWVTLYEKIQAAKFTSRGSLSFLPNWKPVLTNSTLQVAQESWTGAKESHDLGYALRTRYPTFYTEGTKFLAWANLYPRVVQTAQMFIRGYLGPFSSNGAVITVNSTGSPLALGNSLSPGDLCPNYVDENGGTNATSWDAIYLAPITTRLNKLLKGNLNFTESDVSGFPYLCGFESQITGQLSPWCSVFTDSELEDFEYRQDLRYYYGQGPGTPVASQTMMLPFLDSLVCLLSQGPGINGTDASGAPFVLPDLIMAFLNDGQLSSLGAMIGVFDDVAPLSGTKRPRNDWKYKVSRFISMRGTIAFERMSCAVKTTDSYHHTTTKNETFVRLLLNDAVYPVVGCQDGPGKSCLLTSYQAKIDAKYKKAGNWHDNCGVTNPASPKIVKGAEFFTNLGLTWLTSVSP